VASLSGDWHIDLLGLDITYDWDEIRRLEAAGETVDEDDHVYAVEVVATGLIRRPTPEEIQQIKAVSAERRTRLAPIPIPLRDFRGRQSA